MSWKGQKNSGPNCCCCKDLYCNISFGGKVGWALVGVANNVSTIETTPNTDSATSRCTADYRTKYLIGARQVVGNNCELRTWDLAIENRTTRYTFANPLGIEPFVCGDWQSGRFYYTKDTVFTIGTPAGKTTRSVEIHRVDYDGTNDVTLHTESWVNDSTGTFGSLHSLMWEPTGNTLYFVLEKDVQYTSMPPHDVNIFAYIKRLSAEDGSGYATVVSLEETSGASADSSIRGLGFSVAHDKLIWSQLQFHGVITATFDADADVYTADPDGSAAVSILNHSMVAATQLTQTFQNTRFSEKLDQIYFNNRTLISGSTFENRVTRMDIDGGNNEVFMGDRQPNWSSSLRTGTSPQHLLACGRENTGEAFEGAGHPMPVF